MRPPDGPDTPVPGVDFEIVEGKRLLIIGSAQTKLSNNPEDLIIAFELYLGPRYGAFRRWYWETATVEEREDLDVYVLSGLYGLINIWDEVHPYNAAMTPANAERLRPILREQVMRYIQPMKYREIYLCMSERYKKTVLPWLREFCPESRIIVPQPQGFGVGDFIKWLRGEWDYTY